jgi:1-acyl-sn-glycerol-3-phosphate acyltransferase
MIVLGPIKFFTFLLMMFVFIIHHSLVKLFIWDEQRRLNYYLRSISLTARLALGLLNVKVEGKSRTPITGLMVSNHLSYLDVLVYFAFWPALFVTSQEIFETPVLGTLTRLGGCFFVERRKEKRLPGTVAQELRAMKEKIDLGYSVFLFPEGTSTDGSKVLPFKTAFFQTAIDCGVPIRPLALRYTSKNRDLICWYGDMTFTDHLFRLCMEKQVRARVTELPMIFPAPDWDRVLLGTFAHQKIVEAYEIH